MKQTLMLLIVVASLHQKAHSQGFLKKMKDKAQAALERKAEQKVEEKVNGTTPANTNENSTGSTPAQGGVNTSNSTNRAGKPTNKGGEGLKNTTPPDVDQQITDAEAAFAAAKYADARFSVQQALLGVELQLGKQIIASLPKDVSGLPKDTLQDLVTSSHWGWSNLTMQRIYVKDDKQFSVLIGNNATYAGMMDILFSPSVAQSNGQTQNFKQVRVKGNRAVIQFNQHDGYTLLVQLGQAGMITFQAINFATEQDVMSAANNFDIDTIKKALGGQ